MGYYSVIRTNELSCHEKTQRNLKCTVNERRHSEKGTYLMIQSYNIMKIAKILTGRVSVGGGD